MTAYSIDAAALDRLRRDNDIPSVRALAKKMHLSPSTVHRVLAGEQAPGPGFLSGLRRALPHADVYSLIREDIAA